VRVRREQWISGAAALALGANSALAAPDYSVRVHGAPTQQMRENLEMVSVLAQGRREFPTAAALRRAARTDIDALVNALKAGGYYAASASFEIDREGERPIVIFTVSPGRLFRITDYRIVYVDETDAVRPATIADAGVEANGAADGAAVQEAQQRFLTALWDRGFPAALIVSRHADARLEEGTASAVFTFRSGPKAVFGDLRVDGEGETAPIFFEKLKTWSPGEVFDRSKLVAYRDRLAETGLFQSIDVAPGAPDEDGTANVIVTVEERKRRTIGAGVSYSTAEGPGGRIFFENRNLFNRGERAIVEMQASEVEQSLKFNFDKPLPTFPGSAFARFGFVNETTEAYNARTVEMGGGVARRWLDDRLETRGGLAVETSRVRSDDIDQRTYYFSTPLSATWSTEDSLLNPAQGVRASFAVTPHTGSTTFALLDATARTRVSFGVEDRFALAFRTRLGATLGSSLDALPLNKRFYAGGGASVRGYAFQAAGPLGPNDTPIGGRSLVDASIEGRAMVTEVIQLVAFLDAGAVSDQPFPDFGGPYFIGAGVGARYHTQVGPIRLDVAFPLDRRESDRSFQIYISLGQPF
jgi:translocation and assembly module TamA